MSLKRWDEYNYMYMYVARTEGLTSYSCRRGVASELLMQSVAVELDE